MTLDPAGRLTVRQAELAARMRRLAEREAGVRGPDGLLTPAALAARSAHKRDLAAAQLATTRLLLRNPPRPPSTNGR